MSLRRRAPLVVVETHGDWRTATRHGGSRLRVLVAPLADWAARYALRRADALRALSRSPRSWPARRRACRRSSRSRPTSISRFTGRPPAPLPARPTLLFVGMLERSKGVTGSPTPGRGRGAVPDARLVLVGRGAINDVVDRLRDNYPDRVEHVPELPPPGLRAHGRGDLPRPPLALGGSRPGDPRGVRPRARRRRDPGRRYPGPRRARRQRAARGARQRYGIVDALARILYRRGLAARLGAAAHEALPAFEWSPDDYASRVRSLVDRTLSAART